MLRNNERNLVSIQTISKITPIKDADNIELVTVLGWNVVVKKGEFNTGDKCLYFEIDSIVPEHPVFEFLRPRNFKIKTIKLRGQISQGLCLPLSILKEFSISDYDEITNFDSLIGVRKYEPEILPQKNLNGLKPFPNFFPKTDAERIQNIYKTVIKKSIEEENYMFYEVSEKLDGSSFSVYFNRGKFGYCSRNYEITPKKLSIWYRIKRLFSSNVKDADTKEDLLIKDLDLRNKLRYLNRNIAIQGELLGPKIQSNYYKLDKYEWYVFDIFDIDKQKYLEPEERKFLIGKLNLNSVPIIHNSYPIAFLTKTDSVDEFIKFAEGKSQINTSKDREGLVFKLKNERFTFKAISNKYLLKE